MATFLKLIPSLFFALVGLGFEVSGIQSQELAMVLWSIAALLLIIPAWPYLKRVKLRNPITFKESQGTQEHVQNLSVIEFFPTTVSLIAAHPLSETFRPGNQIYACLLTGEGIFAEHRDYMKYVKRLILPDTNQCNIDRLRRIRGGIDYEKQILKYADLFYENDKYSIKLYPDFLGVSLLFCNPSLPSAWVQVGLILPETESAERQHFRIYRATNEAVFLGLYGTFNAMWDKCEDYKTAQASSEEGLDKGMGK